MPVISSEENLIIVLTTEANTELAESLARKILEKKIAACISFKQVNSIFWWEDELEETKEVQLIMKTTEYNLKLVMLAIEEFHSYQLPEVECSSPFSVCPCLLSTYHIWNARVPSPQVTRWSPGL